ncbi:MAG: M1 family metallopeptidase [Dermatophilaceae bacterium]
MTGADPYLPGHGDPRYTVEHYDLALRYKPTGNHLAGSATLRVRALEDLSDLLLDLYGLVVTGLEVDGGTVARWTHRASRLRIRFRGSVPRGERLVIRVGYRGRPRPMPGPDGAAGWEELTDGVLVAAQPHGAPTWFPCNDRMADKASYRVTIETDPEYRVVAAGSLVDTRRAGRRTAWEYVQNQPTAPYLATVQIGRYAVEEQLNDVIPTFLIASPAWMAPARRAFADQPAMLAVFAELFGPYPFDRYTVVVTDDILEIPLESQTLSTFGSNHLARGWDAQRLIAHELAHQWFGNAVTAASLADIWLHEGFACYAEWLWAEASGRSTVDREAARHHRVLAARPQDLVLADPGPDRVFDDRVYKRGALALHALRTVVGGRRFFALVRDWVCQHRYGVVTTADFEAHVASDIGMHGALLSAWIRRPELPALPNL